VPSARRVAESQENYALKVDDLKDACRTRTRDIQLKVGNRINSMSRQSPPSGASLGLNIGNAVAGGIAKAWR